MLYIENLKDYIEKLLDLINEVGIEQNTKLTPRNVWLFFYKPIMNSHKEKL